MLSLFFFSSSDDEYSSTIRTCFHTISNLLRDAPPKKSSTKIKDSIRLRLYACYKCAISCDGDARSHGGKRRPSVFDPVGCAKYDAVKECRERFFGSDDGGDKEKQRVSMTGTDVGRRCGKVYREAMSLLEEKKRRAQTERRGVPRLISPSDGGLTWARALLVSYVPATQPLVSRLTASTGLLHTIRYGPRSANLPYPFKDSVQPFSNRMGAVYLD